MNTLLTSQNPIAKCCLATRVLVYLGLLCFVVSLFQTVLFTSGDDIQGYWVFILGWMGIVIFQLSWFANPLNLLALLLLLKRPRLSFLLSILAFVLASQTLSFSEIPIGLHANKIYIKELGLGFYFWYLSQGLILLSICIELVLKINQRPLLNYRH